MGTRTGTAVPVFDDWRSLGHFLIAVVAALLGCLFIPLVVIVFTLYQLLENEDATRKAGDLAEFLLGVATGCSLRLLLQPPHLPPYS